MYGSMRIGQPVDRIQRSGYSLKMESNGNLAANIASLTLAQAAILNFGADTNLYRSAANTLKTDDHFVALSLNSGSTHICCMLGDTNTIGELTGGVRLQTNTASDLFIIPDASGGTAGKYVGFGYYSGAYSWLSAVEIANTASGYGTLELMKSGGTVKIGQSSVLLFGADTNLYRSAADSLKTDDDFYALSIRGNPTQASYTAFAAKYGAVAQYCWYMSGDGTMNWGNGTDGVDTNLYRYGTNILATDDFFLAIGGASDARLGVLTTGKSYECLSINGNGAIWWSSGDGVVDTNLYRDSANHLRTDDIFMIGATNVFQIYPDFAGVNELAAGSMLYMAGSGGSVNLLAGAGTAGEKVLLGYKSVASLGWLSAVEVANTASGYGVLDLMKSGGIVRIGINSTNSRGLRIGTGYAGGGAEWPAGVWVDSYAGSLVLSASGQTGTVGEKLAGLYYNQSGWLSAFEIAHVASGYGTLDLMKSGGTVKIGSTSILQFGADTNLYRSAANILRTDDKFMCVGLGVFGTTTSSGATINTIAPGSGTDTVNSATYTVTFNNSVKVFAVELANGDGALCYTNYLSDTITILGSLGSIVASATPGATQLGISKSANSHDIVFKTGSGAQAQWAQWVVFSLTSSVA